MPGSTTVFSDVSLAGSIVNDNGVASLTTLTYNPLEDSDAHDITFYMNVIVDQIDVEFMRTDGRNVEGVDVPYRFTQPMNMLVAIDDVIDIPFVLIRHVAKLEAPLLALREVPSQDVRPAAGGQGHRPRQGPGRAPGGAGDRLYQRLVRQFRRSRQMTPQRLEQGDREHEKNTFILDHTEPGSWRFRPASAPS